jgi:hypothetical protein
MKEVMKRLLVLLALPMLAAVPRQAPATFRLTQIGPDTIPIVLRNAEGKALLTIVRETLTLGPGDRVLRVTTMHVDAYDRFPCDMLKELRARQRAGEVAGSGLTPPPAAPGRTDTTAAECAAMRTGTDSLPGSVSTQGGRRLVTWTPAAAGTKRIENRAWMEQKGDVLELRPEATPGDTMPVLPLRYRRVK